MPISTIKARLPYDVATVWSIITSSNDYRWRSDIVRIEKLSDKQFMEYTRSGYATLFTITIFQPFERYEFDLENENIKGHWCGLLSQEMVSETIRQNISSKTAICLPERFASKTS